MAEKEKRVSRGMPNNVEAEASVLGSILIDNRAADTVVPMLHVADFFLQQNRAIFEVMRSLQESGKPVDTVSVADGLELKGKLNEIGIDYLSDLAEGVPSAANCEYYAEIVKRDSLIRKVISAGNDIVKFGYECSGGAEALDNAEKLVYKIAEESSEKALIKADGALAEAMKIIQNAQSGNVSPNAIYTDFPHFDGMTRGLKPGEMVLLAARPSVGKTAFALNIAANSCLNHGKKVAVFSLEMPDYLLVKRMLAYVSKVSLEKMDKRGSLSPAEDMRIFNAYNALLAAGLYIDDYSMNTPGDVLSKCRRMKHEIGLDLVIIDYLQLMTGGSMGGRSAESRQVEVSEMSRKMKIYAKELDVPILILSQMSRGIEQRQDDHTPKLSDLRESGSIEQDADIVMFLHNPSKYNPALPANQIILDVKKNRNGPIGEIKLDWNGETTSFREWAEEGAALNAEAPKYIPAQQTTAKAAGKGDDVGSASVIVDIAPKIAEFNDIDGGLKAIGKDIDEKLLPAAINDAEVAMPFDEGAPLPTDSDAPSGGENDDDEYVDDDDDGDLPFDAD